MGPQWVIFRFLNVSLAAFAKEITTITFDSMKHWQVNQKNLKNHEMNINHTHPQIPEYLPGEPVPPGSTFLFSLIRIFGRTAGLILLAILTAPLWLFYWLGIVFWGSPPNVPKFWQVKRYLHLVWTSKPPAPGIPLDKRYMLTIAVILKVVFAPVLGLAWFLDELLYGRVLNSTKVIAPLIEISAGRSGSTQLARYLEDDPRLVAPSLLQSLFPYLWLWKLAPSTIGRILSPDAFRRFLERQLPKEFLERHEGDPFRTDTFDGAIYTTHFNSLAFHLGPEVAVEDFGFARISPHNRSLWEVEFIQLFDRIARKTLAFAGTGANGERPRFFVKGHFLCAADALEEKYPDASFLCMIREPAARLQSAINYIRVNPHDSALGPLPWGWLVDALTRTETEYCEVEQQWFSRQGGAKRYVIRFADFVADLQKTMMGVYSFCFGDKALPPHVPHEHPPRERKKYRINRSIADLGIDESQLNSRLASYLDWCKKSE